MPDHPWIISRRFPFRELVGSGKLDHRIAWQHKIQMLTRRAIIENHRGNNRGNLG